MIYGWIEGVYIKIPDVFDVCLFWAEDPPKW